MYDYLIVGTGLFGSVCARELTDAGLKVLMIDKRPQAGGNVYTKNIEGIQCSIYGPHIFHTNSQDIWDYVNKYTEFNNYINRVKAIYKDELYSLPINLMTMNKLWGVKTPAEAHKKLAEVRVPIEKPRNFEEVALSMVGQEIYEIFFKGYTIKQWKKDPKELPSFILKRLPYRLNYDDNYFNHRFQGMPVDGYTIMMDRIQKGIDTQLNVNFFEIEYEYWKKQARKIIYTGKIDEFFDYELGELEWINVDFEHDVYDTEDYQGTAVVNYTDIKVPHTRSTEHKHFYGTKSDKTVVTKEIPAEYNRDKTPYYPLFDDKNKKLYSKYKKLIKNETDTIFGGRLGDFKYYDMHQVIASALKCVGEEVW